MGSAPALMPGPCPFWLADTAGWKNSTGICRRGLEASGEKGLGGAAEEEEEVLGTAQEVGTEPSLGVLNTGCKTLGKTPVRSYESKKRFCAIPRRTGFGQNPAFRAHQARLQARLLGLLPLEMETYTPSGGMLTLPT